MRTLATAYFREALAANGANRTLYVLQCAGTIVRTSVSQHVGLITLSCQPLSNLLSFLVVAQQRVCAAWAHDNRFPILLNCRLKDFQCRIRYIL